MAIALSAVTDATLAEGVAELCRIDPDIAAVVARFGPPPLWSREPGFGTLVQIILEQQVSLASGAAAYARLLAAAGDATAERIARLDETAIRGAGLTRQKASYVRLLASAIVEGRFDPARLASLDDEAARSELLGLKGVGGWSADIYLLMALGRPDIWPRGDLALDIALREVKRLRRAPGLARAERITAAWRPWRAVAARILWHHYLSTPRVRVRAGATAARSSRPRTARPSGRPGR